MRADNLIISDKANYKLQLFGTKLLLLTYLDDAEIDLDKIIEINDRGLDLVKRQAFYSIVDLRDVFGEMSNDAKKFVAENEELNKLKKVEFLLVNSLPLKILTMGYLTINKPKTKTIVVRGVSELLKALTNFDSELKDLSSLEDYLQQN